MLSGVGIVLGTSLARWGGESPGVAPPSATPGTQGRVKVDVLNGGGFSMALVVVRPELVATLERRLEGKGTVVLEVTLQNREQLRGQIVSMLGEKGGAA